jgi:predicted alpha/beta superfamily hydrolase
MIKQKGDERMENGAEKRIFRAAGRTVTVYPAAEPGRPAVYLNTFADEGGRARELLHGEDFTLAVIGDLDWDRDMAPWDAPALSERSAAFSGGAADYLRVLEGEIVPETERMLPAAPAWRGLAGYSLAGLFALWALYETALFARAASVSGSLWYPGLREFALSHEPRTKPECLYFSLGDRESRTGNPYLQTVQARTEELEARFAAQGVRTVFELNPGSHNKNAAARTAAGIRWILNR